MYVSSSCSGALDEVKDEDPLCVIGSRDSACVCVGVWWAGN